MVLASTIGQIAHPFYIAFAWLLAEFYSFIPNYAIAIALLTIAVMIVVFPITRKGTRSMMKMQLLSPEMKKLQAKYKAPPGATAVEKNANRTAMNEEMMALYKENGVSPTGGCLPMFLQFPIFIILYDTIRGLTATKTIGTGIHARVISTPLYISHSTLMYQNIKAAHGKLEAFGLNLGNDALTHGLSAFGRIPYIAMILVALVLQYIQLKQMSGRNPAAAQANPQMQQMQKVMPLIFGIIYIRIAAGVNVYFIISSLFRIGQQEYMYRRDPDLRSSIAKLRARASEDPKVLEAKARITAERNSGRTSLRDRLMPGPTSPVEEVAAQKSPRPRPAPGTPRPRPQARPRPNGSSSNGRARSGATSAAGKGTEKPAPRTQPRAQGKRPRKPR